MTLTNLIALPIAPIAKAVRRWIIRRHLAAIRYEIAGIQRERAQGFLDERTHQARQALLISELHGL